MWKFLSPPVTLKATNVILSKEAHGRVVGRDEFCQRICHEEYFTLVVGEDVSLKNRNKTRIRLDFSDGEV